MLFQYTDSSYFAGMLNMQLLVCYNANINNMYTANTKGFIMYYFTLKCHFCKKKTGILNSSLFCFNCNFTFSYIS